MRQQAHGLAVDGDQRSEVEAVGQVALVEFDAELGNGSGAP